MVSGAEIVASRAATEEMLELTPQKMAQLMGLARTAARMGGASRVLGKLLSVLGVGPLANVLEAGEFVDRLFGEFDFSGIELTRPERTFEKELALSVGERSVELFEVGPAHTLGDVIAWLPEERVLFAGDILFIDAHPLLWQGPVGRWVEALDRILALDAEVIVPGHGPITDRTGVEAVKRYWLDLEPEARRRFEAGVGAEEAAAELYAQGFYDHWIDRERVAVNVDSLYRGFRGETEKTDAVELFARMARLDRST
jgi:glyoxylase-like metal-dependent hydrolase (beta-lactamase superfamily II)